MEILTGDLIILFVIIYKLTFLCHIVLSFTCITRTCCKFYTGNYGRAKKHFSCSFPLKNRVVI